MNCKWRVLAFRLTVSSSTSSRNSILNSCIEMNSMLNMHFNELTNRSKRWKSCRIGKSQINNLFSQQRASDSWHRDNFNRVTEFKCYKLFELSNFCDLINNPDKFLEYSFDRYICGSLPERFFNKSSIISFERYEFLIISSMHSGMFFEDTQYKYEKRILYV